MRSVRRNFVDLMVSLSNHEVAATEAPERTTSSFDKLRMRSTEAAEKRR